MTIPKRLQPILWSKYVDALDPQKDKNYIVHQVLMYGSLDEIKWLFENYHPEEVRRIFIEHPKKIYTPQAFSFIKKIVLGVVDPNVREDNYVKTTY